MRRYLAARRLIRRPEVMRHYQDSTRGWGDADLMSTGTFLILEDILVIHEGLVARFGRPQGVRDVGALRSAVTRPGTGNYDGFLEETGALMEGLAMNHWPLWGRSANGRYGTGQNHCHFRVAGGVAST